VITKFKLFGAQISQNSAAKIQRNHKIQKIFEGKITKFKRFLKEKSQNSNALLVNSEFGMSIEGNRKVHVKRQKISELLALLGKSMYFCKK